MTHQDYKEMIPAHALSALDPADDRVLSEHLESCGDCRRELDEWQITAVSLSFSADPLEPSPQVRERILSRVREDNAAASSSKVLPFSDPSKRNVWSSFGSLGTIAATVVFALLLISVVVLWRNNRAMEQEIAKLTSQTEKTQQELNDKAKLVDLLKKPGTRMAELTGMPIAPGATAKLAYDTTGHAMVMTEGLPTVPAGKQYQLWFIVNNKPMPGRSFSTDNGGAAVLEDQVPAAAMNQVVFAITLERSGGVPSPEGPIYLRSNS